jgi:hypothetical protein
MITVTGRLVAAIIMILAGLALAAIGTFIAVSGRLTGHEALAGFTALLAAAGAALWLRRDRLRGRRP